MHDDDDVVDVNVDEEEDGKAVKQPNWKRNQQEIELRTASCVCAAWAALTVGLCLWLWYAAWPGCRWE